MLGGSALGDPLQEAREHYHRATKAYEVGQYDEAIQEFAAAYKLKDDPSILFNLAQAHRMAGHRAEALRTYRMFLVKVPDSPNRREVEAMMANLQQQHGDDPDSDLARRYFDMGTKLFEAQRYEAAIIEFEKARLVKPQPILDLNIGRGHDRLGHIEQALASFRLYVESKPEPADAVDVRERIKTLEERLSAKQPSTVTQPAPTVTVSTPQTKPASAHPGRALTIAGIAVGVVGLAALGGGIGAGVIAQQNSDDLTKLNQMMGKFSASKESAGKSAQIAEGVLLGVGGAAVVAGVALIVVGQRAAHRSLAVAPAIGPGRVGAVLEGSF